jgi:small conductance mechanosensitive channel
MRLGQAPGEEAGRMRFGLSACRWGIRVLHWALWLLILEHVLRSVGAAGSLQFLASAIRNMGLLALLVAFLTLERRALGRLLEVGEEGSYAALLALYNRAVLQLYTAALAFVAIVGGLWLSGYRDRAEWVLRSTGLTLLVLLATWAAHRWSIALLRRKVPDDDEGATPWYRTWMEQSVRAVLALLSLLALGDVWSVQLRLMYGTFTSSLLRDGALRTAMVLVIALAARFAVLTMRFVIYRIFAVRTVAAGTEPILSPRGMTLAPLLTSCVRYTVYFIAVALALQTVGLDPTPLVAGAGVVGLAVGFGAQSLVKDVITGFFIIAEDLISVGETVELDGKLGVVEEITVRVTMLRLYSGELRIIPNSEIRQIGNRSRGFMRAIVPVTIRRSVDADLAMQALREIVQAYHERHRDIVLGSPEVHGILDMDPISVTIRAVMKVRPSSVVGVEHELRREIRRVFDERGLGARQQAASGVPPEPVPAPAPPPALDGKPPR